MGGEWVDTDTDGDASMAQVREEVVNNSERGDNDGLGRDSDVVLK